MKTSNTTANQPKNRTFMRIAMVILGIATAIVGTLSDVQLVNSGEDTSEMISTTKVAVADFSIQVANTVASTLWPF